MTPGLLFGLLSAPGAHMLRRWCDAGAHTTDPRIVPDDLRDFHRLVVALDSSRQKATTADTGVDCSDANVDDGPMTYKATANRLGCCPRTVTRMVERGELPTVKVGKRRRIPVGAIASLIRGGQHGG